MKAQIKPMPKRAIVMTPEEAKKRFPVELKAATRYAVLEDTFNKTMKRLLRVGAGTDDVLILRLVRQLHEIEHESESLLREHPWMIEGWPGLLRQHNIVLKEFEGA